MEKWQAHWPWLNEVFMTASSARDGLKKSRTRMEIAGLDCLPSPPGLCFSRQAFPHSNAALPMATQELESFPGRELVPHLAFPTPGVAPDVDTAELYSGHYRLFHGTVSFSPPSFLLFTFLYTASIIPIASLGCQLGSCAAVLQSKRTYPLPNSTRASCPPPFRSRTSP